MNTSNTLNISHVSFDDAGRYGCSAENWAGKFNKTFWIDVTGISNVTFCVKHLFYTLFYFPSDMGIWEANSRIRILCTELQLTVASKRGLDRRIFSHESLF